jgi:hypothetical protein
MEKRGRNPGDQVENEEDLLNFDLDELSTQDLDQMSFNSDDEIIELTELVEKGPGDEETRAMDGSWRKGSPSSEIEPDIDFSTNEIAKAMDGTPDESSSEDEIDLSELSLELGLKDKGEGKPEVEPKGYEGEITADELDSILEERSLKRGIEMAEEPQQEAEPEGDISSADLEGLLDESSQEEVVVDLGEEPEAEEQEMSVEEQRAAVDFLESAREDNAAVALEPEEEPESEREIQAYIDMENVAPPSEAEPDDTVFQPTSPESVGISEEKIEAAITRAVEDVAERVIRETVAEVTERVLNEVIDALKKSLESDSE